jgi:hypothetical protein
VSEHVKTVIWPTIFIYLEQRGADLAFAANVDREILPLLQADCRERDAFGQKKYGDGSMVAWNGKNALREAYEEALDQIAYLGQDLYETEINHASGLKTDRLRRIKALFRDAITLAFKIRAELKARE